MANDALLIGIDKIHFNFLKNKKMRVYAIGLTADNLGKIILTSPPAVTQIIHKPKLGRPAVWDFGGDGYSIYQRLGGLPDFVAAHLLLVRDRSNLRSTGELLQEIAGTADVQSAASSASGKLQSAGGALAASTGVSLIHPVLEAIDGLLSKKKDKVLTTLSGSLFLDPERQEERAFTETIQSPDNNFIVTVDALLFDAVADEDFEPVDPPDLGIELAGAVEAAAAGN